MRHQRKIKKLKSKIFFLAGLPRSGNTILTSILNQNPDVCCTPNSVTLEIFKDLFLLKKTNGRSKVLFYNLTFGLFVLIPLQKRVIDRLEELLITNI